MSNIDQIKIEANDSNPNGIVKIRLSYPAELESSLDAMFNAAKANNMEYELGKLEKHGNLHTLNLECDKCHLEILKDMIQDVVDTIKKTFDKGDDSKNIKFSPN